MVRRVPRRPGISVLTSRQPDRGCAGTGAGSHPSTLLPRPPTRRRSPRRAEVWLCGRWLVAGASALLVGCAAGTDISGYWQASAAASAPLLGSATSPTHVELIIGHYGRDLSGLLRFYHDPAFEQPADPAAPHFDCSCVLLHRGRWSETSLRASFETRGCLPGASPEQPLLVSAQLALVDGELDGELATADGASRQPIRFAAAGNIDDADLRCDTYTAAAAGNLANGL